MKIRINKLLSEAGLGSRREVEQLIEQGRVLINGKRANLSSLVDKQDTLLLDDLDLPTKDLVQECLALQKLQQHENGKEAKRVPKRSKAEERAESQRLKHANKSAALRKSSKNNPSNKMK